VEGEPRRGSQRERSVELCHQYVQVWCEGGRAGSTVGDEEGDRTCLVDLCCDCKWEVQLAPLMTQAVMSQNMAAIRGAWSCSEGVEQEA